MHSERNPFSFMRNQRANSKENEGFLSFAHEDSSQLCRKELQSLTQNSLGYCAFFCYLERGSVPSSARMEKGNLV